MVHNRYAVPSVEPRVRRRAVVKVAVGGALDLALVALLLLLDSAQVQSQKGLAHVELGLPLNWITQSQNINPPLPWRTTFLSPMENYPTTIAWLPLIVNVVVVGLLLTGMWISVQAARSRRSAK